MKIRACLLFFFFYALSEGRACATDEEKSSLVSNLPSFSASLPVNSSNMFSKLVFNVEGDSIEFHSHEFVRIAQELLKGIASGPPTKIPPYLSYDSQVETDFDQFTKDVVSRAAEFYGEDESELHQLIDVFYRCGPNVLLGNPKEFEKYLAIMGRIRSKKSEIEPLIKEEYDERILPVAVIPEHSASGWLGVARYLTEAEEPITGWWIDVGSRLILLKNAPKQRGDLYVSDHGFRAAVLQSTKENLLVFVDHPEQLQYPFYFWRFYSELSENDQQLLKQRFVLKSMENSAGSATENEFLLYRLSLPQSYKDVEGAVFSSIGRRDKETDPLVFPLSDDEKQVLGAIPRKTYGNHEKIFRLTMERVRHRGGIQSPLFIQSLFSGGSGGLSPFFTQIDNIFAPADSERYRTFFTLREISKKSGKGLQEFLFRPLYCFGSSEEGESYRGFAEAFDEYYKSDAPRPECELAKETRSLLQGNSLQDGSLFFLPNLVAAWFISETARNQVSILSGLMLLDLVESGVVLTDREGNNRYSWRHTLIHPKKPADSRVKVNVEDLYGKPIDLANFDGIHPMAHAGSVADSNRPLGKENLSAVQQKEGHLIVHWLHERLKKLPNPIVSVPVPGLLEKPEYGVIDKLLTARDNPSNSIKKDLQLKKKWDLLQTIKFALQERLSTLDFLLGT